MKNFLNDHPIMSFLMLATICETAIVITKILTHTEMEPMLMIRFNKESEEKKDIKK